MSLKQKEIKIKSRIKVNHNIYNSYMWFQVEVNTFQTGKSSVQVSAVP